MDINEKLKIAVEALNQLATRGVQMSVNPVVPPHSTAGEKYDFFYTHMDQMDTNVKNIALDALDQINKEPVRTISSAPVAKAVALSEVLTNFQTFVLTGNNKDAQRLFSIISRNIAPTEAGELQELWFRIQGYGLTVQFEFNKFVEYLIRMHANTTVTQYLK
jgi:hypothetical protein